MHKIVVAITGASGSIYPKILLDKLQMVKDQWASLAIVITDNAKIGLANRIGKQLL